MIEWLDLMLGKLLIEMPKYIFSNDFYEIPLNQLDFLN